MDKEKKVDNTIYSSEHLRGKLNEERQREGLGEVFAVNPKGCGASNYARKDESYSSVPNFFYKVFFKRKKK